MAGRSVVLIGHPNFSVAWRSENGGNDLTCNVLIGGAHALFGVRLVFAKLTASRQRTIDRDRFQALKEQIGHESTKTRNLEEGRVS